jgi:hypothetical protein
MQALHNKLRRGSYRSLPEQRSPSSVFRFLPSRDSKVRLAICHSLCPIRVNARSRCAPARCAGARAERPVAGGRSRGQRWAQGQHAASRTNAAHQFTNRPLMNSVHLHARMHVASCSRRVHHRDRHQHTIPIERSLHCRVHTSRDFVHWRFFGRRRAEPADRLVIAGVQKPEQIATLQAWLKMKEATIEVFYLFFGSLGSPFGPAGSAGPAGPSGPAIARDVPATPSSPACVAGARA